MKTVEKFVTAELAMSKKVLIVLLLSPSGQTFTIPVIDLFVTLSIRRKTETQVAKKVTAAKVSSAFWHATIERERFFLLQKWFQMSHNINKPK